MCPFNSTCGTSSIEQYAVSVSLLVVAAEECDLDLLALVLFV